MILITQIYNNNKVRYNEMIKALKLNCKNRIIDKIILLNEKKLNLDSISPKIKQIIIGKRLTYKIAFDYSNNNFDENNIIILANSDIWFDNSIEIINRCNMVNKVFALSRYDFTSTGNYVFFNNFKSQDCWIYQNPIKLQFPHNFYLGRLGCDNRIAWIISKSKKNKVKYIIRNPSLTIKCYHEHLSNIRNYTQKNLIKGPYLYLLPNRL